MSSQLFLALCIFLLAYNASSDISADKAQCADQLVGMAACLTYVGGTAKAPTPDCCNGLQQVLGKSPKCLCLLIKDHDDPQIGIQINITRALYLPTACDSPQNVSACAFLLNLPPNSKGAEIFRQAANITSIPKEKGDDSKTNGGNNSNESQNSVANGGHQYWKTGKEAMKMVVFCGVVILSHFGIFA